MTWHQVPGEDAIYTHAALPAAALHGIPHARSPNMVVVRNDYRTWQALRDRGLVVPPPLGTFKWAGRHTPRKHQRDGVEFLIANQRGILIHGLGCVDAETEYLTPTGWKRIDQYDGGLVAQYDKASRAVSFVQPEQYIDLPCERFLKLKTRNLDQMLSDEHRMFIRCPNGREEIVRADEVYRRQQERLAANKGQRLGGLQSEIAFTQAKMPISFVAPGGAGVAMSDALLRLQIAVIADGHFPYPKIDSVIIRLKKERKKERLRKLLADAGIEYTQREITEEDGRCDPGFCIFRFQAPRHEKEFTSWWWDLDAHQLEIFRDEVLHWDGSFATGNRFASFHSGSKASIDFVQYVFAGAGYGTSIRVDAREGRKDCYQMTISKRGQVGLHGTSVGGMGRTAMQYVETPGARKYCFTVPTGLLVLRRNGRVFVTGNSGKTLTSAWAMDYLFSQGAIKKVLIVAPKSVAGHVWTRELFFSFPNLRTLFINGDAKKKRKIATDSADVYIINYESLHVIKDIQYDLIICDEAIKLKTPQTKTWKLINEMAQHCRLWLLTGLPTPQGPMDALGLIKLLKGPQAMTKTRWQMLTMRQITQFKWLPLPDADRTVAKWLQPSHCVRSEDCYDVPDVETIELEYDLTPEQQEFSKELAKEARAELMGKTITATNAAHVLQKLLQVQAGGVYGEDRCSHPIPAEPFFGALGDLVESADTPVLLFCAYKINAHAVSEYLSSRGLDNMLVTGDTSSAERNKAFNRIERRELRALVAVPSTMSHGIDNLVSARYMVWCSPIFSADVYGQAVGRLVRQGQKNSVKVYRMVGSKVVKSLFARLDDKAKLQDAVLELIG